MSSFSVQGTGSYTFQKTPENEGSAGSGKAGQGYGRPIKPEDIFGSRKGLSWNDLLRAVWNARPELKSGGGLYKSQLENMSNDTNGKYTETVEAVQNVANSLLQDDFHFDISKMSPKNMTAFLSLIAILAAMNAEYQKQNSQMAALSMEMAKGAAEKIREQGQAAFASAGVQAGIGIGMALISTGSSSYGLAKERTIRMESPSAKAQAADRAAKAKLGESANDAAGTSKLGAEAQPKLTSPATKAMETANPANPAQPGAAPAAANSVPEVETEAQAAEPTAKEAKATRDQKQQQLEETQQQRSLETQNDAEVQQQGNAKVKNDQASGELRDQVNEGGEGDIEEPAAESLEAESPEARRERLKAEDKEYYDSPEVKHALKWAEGWQTFGEVMRNIGQQSAQLSHAGMEVHTTEARAEEQIQNAESRMANEASSANKAAAESARQFMDSLRGSINSMIQSLDSTMSSAAGNLRI